MAGTSHSRANKGTVETGRGPNGGELSRRHGGVRHFQQPGVFNRLRKEIDQLFDDFMGGDWPSFRHRQWDLDVEEEDGSVTVRAEAPGFEPDDFDIRVQGDSLVMCACRQSETGEEGERQRTWSRQEFHRTVTLPEGVDADKIDATYRNGILTVKVPISEEHRPKRIAVRG
jgi:HSP20 family protein